MSPQGPKSATIIEGAILDDKRDPDISIPAQTSTTLRPQFVDHSPGNGDEGYPVPSKAPPTTPALQSLKDRDARGREDTRTSVSIAPATVDHSIREANHDNLVRTEMLLVTSKHPSIDRGDGAVQNREARHGVDPDFPFPTEAPTVAIEPCSVVCKDGDMGSKGVPSISLFQGSSNFQISNTNLNTISGNATIIRFGDGQFTEIQRNLICDYIANLTVLPDISNKLKRHVLTQSIISIPRVEAVFNDYQTKKKSGPCFEGTRVALLREMADWVTSTDESRMYVLSGLAGIGKSTVAYTIASRAADLNLLGASFFFSRDEADRNNAKKFFTTIAYQLCVYNETFSKAIGDVLLTERGAAATTKDPQEQLQVLILDPLRSIVQSLVRPILVIVDALDECDEADEHAVVMGLTQLVRLLPSFKVILTTRPQPLVDHLFGNHDGHKIFRLQDIENKVVDGDIRLYLLHSFSQEQVRACLRNSKGEWCPSDEDIESLVRAAGRLFIIASTTVLYVLNKTLGDPGARMKRLLGEIAQDRSPFHALNHFYSVIVRSAIQVDDGDDDVVDRYRIIVGTIVVIQTPLPITTLACFVGEESGNIYAMLQNLQSVISLGGDDVPRIYHKSFPDYLTDQVHCKDPRLRIDTRVRHTQIATRCFDIMDKHLRRNILGLGDPAQFMSNEDGRKEDGITNEQILEKIPQQLHYACVYWANHLEVAHIEDADLMKGLKKFVDEHMLHWLEVLSLIGKLDSAHHAIRVALTLLKSMSSDLNQLLSDMLRFISKFYELVKRSALHTYYSALPFTPSDSLLYRRYINDAVHDLCSIEGVPEKWDALVANMSHCTHARELAVNTIKFSLASALLISCSEEDVDLCTAGKLKIWDAATGTPISTIPGHTFAVANDVSTVASSEDKTITFYNVNGSARGTMFTTSSMIKKLGLSSESSRVAAALADGTVWLWDSENAELIDSFDEFQSNRDGSQLQISPTGKRLAYSSANTIKLRDGISGRFIADLRCGSGDLYFEFSGDGSRIASLSDESLTLCDSESGGLIGTVIGVGSDALAISANGSLLATADNRVTLWSENRDHLAQIKVLEVDEPSSMAFSLDNILAIATEFDIKLYNVKTHSFIHTLPLGSGDTAALAFSPDCTRLAVGGYNVNLWDIRGIDPSSPPSKGNVTAVTALTLSRDCSRLACGFVDGTVELWGTSPTKQRIVPLVLRSKMAAIFFRILGQFRHTKPVRALGFDPDGRLFASGSDDGTIKLWNGGDGALRGTLKAPGRLQAVALSNSVLVATWRRWYGGVTLWSLDTLNPIHTFDGKASKVSITENSTLIAVFLRSTHVALLDVVNRTTIATFDVPSNIDTMTFLPDNSQLVVRFDKGVFLSLNLSNNHIIKEPTLEHLVQLPNIPLWHGVPVCHCQDKDSKQHSFAALFSQDKNPVPVLWIPREIPVTAWAQGSSMIALGCEDGRVILLRLPTNHVS
ncbi:hypothetical protein M378DRAFT_12905 [Amanita muscaria Koide BX008]|uniref:NACHT domain-containing protein n=1 Tax=Amanita muscaria (strain Koide BX008) TaxID=946122 RepID=A0A0C2WL74_AMAMK|nr:hypothetical protein M378DRAFT_12905 [Amanita muscaria Koide BX008]